MLETRITNLLVLWNKHTHIYTHDTPIRQGMPFNTANARMTDRVGETGLERQGWRDRVGETGLERQGWRGCQEVTR